MPSAVPPRRRGERVTGKVLPGSGGDWLRLRPDGSAFIDVRITIKTDDDARIYMRYEGIIAGDALPRLLGGEAVPPGEYYFRTTPYFGPARRSMRGSTMSSPSAWASSTSARAGSATGSTR